MRNCVTRSRYQGLGLPSEMASYTKNGCAPEFALWSFNDLGYLTYYLTYMLATGQSRAPKVKNSPRVAWANYTITKDPTRANAGLRVLMGPFSVYNKDNIDKEVGGAPHAPQRHCRGQRKRARLQMVLLPKFLGIAVV